MIIVNIVIYQLLEEMLSSCVWVVEKRHSQGKYGSRIGKSCKDLKKRRQLRNNKINDRHSLNLTDLHLSSVGADATY
jgi:hypothetical protein